MSDFFKKRSAHFGAFLFIVIAIGVFSMPPKIANAQISGSVGLFVPVNDVPNNMKEFGLDSAAWMAAKILIEQISDSLVDWINSGFEGNPGFIQNPDTFFTNVGDQIAGNFIAGSALGFLCEPFQLDIRFSLNFNYNARFDRQIGCTLTDVISNVENFTEFTSGDFSQGGWTGWFSLTQNPQNNPYGAYLISMDELEKRVQEGGRIELMKLDWGNGFLSMQDENGNVQTPGALIENQLATHLTSDIRKLEMADEFNEILGALVNQLIQQVFLGPGGLVGADPEVSVPPNELYGWCEANKDVAEIGENVRWRAGVYDNGTGGTGGATYQWFGNIPLAHQTGQHVDVVYDTEGIKTGRVRITLNGQTETFNCLNAVSVEAIN